MSMGCASKGSSSVEGEEIEVKTSARYAGKKGEDARRAGMMGADPERIARAHPRGEEEGTGRDGSI